MKTPWRYVVITVVFALLCFLPHGITLGAARSSGRPWSDPVRLDIEGGTSPVAVSDERAVVHVFWGSASGSPSGSSAVFYSQLRGDSWSQPIDILAAPNGEWVQVFQAVIDHQGWIHLIVESGGAFYTTAHVTETDSALNWARPVQLSWSQTTPDLVLDTQDNLHLIYTGDPRRDPLVYHRLSSDHGISWSPPDIVALPQPDAYPINVRMTVDAQDKLHAIWCESVAIFPPSGVYYAQSTDGGQTWTPPLEIAAGGYSWGSVGIDGKNNVHLFWTGTGAWAGKYHTWSSDGGTSWAPVEILWRGLAGFLGFADMAVDSAGAFYLVTGAGNTAGYFGIPTQGEIIYTQWRANAWTAPVHLSKPIMNGYYEQSWPQITIVLGNQAYVVWSVLDHRNGGNSIWYVSGELDAPPVPSVEIPDVSLEHVDSEVLPTQTVEVESNEDSLPFNTSPSATSGITSQFVLGVSAASVVVILILVAIVNAARNQR